MGRATNGVGMYEDPLTHLPHKSVQEFARGQVIYSPANPAAMSPYIQKKDTALP